MKIVALIGSLRKESLNRKVFQNCFKILPDGVELIEAKFADLPIYNADLHTKDFPPMVQALGQQIRDADALLFITPEYNYSVPGGLKNALDWVSRLPDQPFAGKLAGIMGASPGKLGTARGQYHLRQIGVFLDIRFINRPEIMISNANNIINDLGEITDQTTLSFMKTQLSVLAEEASTRR